jgi:GNAT superfamily N-acetyltransferase
MPTSSVIEIRVANEADAPAIAACLAAAFEGFRSQYTDAAYADTVADEPAVRARLTHMAIFVAVAADGAVVGTLAASATGNAGHLRGLAVREAWQGSSVAKDLLNAVEHWLITAGCTEVTLHVTAVLHRAMRFYEKNGFSRTGRTEDFFGMPLAEFSKPLSVR